MRNGHALKLHFPRGFKPFGSVAEAVAVLGLDDALLRVLEREGQRLLDVLSNFAGFVQCELVLVFDGYRVANNRGEKSDYHNIHVVYTKEHETADAYIERLANDIGKNERVRVVTSDSLIQLSALRSGVLRTSARDFRNEVRQTEERIEQAIRDLNG